MRQAVAETVMQQSLRSIDEYAQDVLAECDARNIDVADLQSELDAHGLSDDHSEIVDALERLSDAGYANEEGNDHLHIYEQGSYWFDGDDRIESGAVVDA